MIELGRLGFLTLLFDLSLFLTLPQRRKMRTQMSWIDTILTRKLIVKENVSLNNSFEEYKNASFRRILSAFSNYHTSQTVSSDYWFIIPRKRTSHQGSLLFFTSIMKTKCSSILFSLIMYLTIIWVWQFVSSYALQGSFSIYVSSFLYKITNKQKRSHLMLLWFLFLLFIIILLDSLISSHPISLVFLNY